MLYKVYLGIITLAKLFKDVYRDIKKRIYLYIKTIN